MAIKLILFSVGAIVGSVVFAAEPVVEGYRHTGDGIQTAAHWPFTMELFTVSHDVNEVPASKSRQAMIELDADKRLTLHMLRDVGVDHLKTGLQDRYALNGYSDLARIKQFLTPLTGSDVPNGSTITITYDAKAKRTTFEVQGGASASVDSVEFMKATWSIWFGNSKPAHLGDQLVSKLASDS